MEHLSKRERRKANSQTKTTQNNSLRLRRITPLTETQATLFNVFDKYQVLSLDGYPGTGKTFLALFKALELMEYDDTYHQLMIIRSSVAVRDAGFLPGNIREKMAVFEAPYQALLTELYGRSDAYQILKNKGLVDFVSTAHMRGTTFSDCIVLIDECQNMSYQELNTLLTRVGENCKLILCGDIYQDDLTSERFREQSGYKDVLQILTSIGSCRNVKFTADDIVRSGFVKDYILAKIRFEKIGAVKPVNLMEIAESVANTMLTE